MALTCEVHLCFEFGKKGLHMNRFVFTCVAFCALSHSALLADSNRGSITGTVKDPTGAGIPGFVAVAPNHQYLALEGGLGDVRSGQRAMRMLVDPPADSSLHCSLHQTLTQIHVIARNTEEIWYRGTGQNLTLELTCFDRDSRILLRKARRAMHQRKNGNPPALKQPCPTLV